MSDNPMKCRTGPTEDISTFSDPPTVTDLSELLMSLTNWQQFGIHLPGIDDATIQKIERDKPENIELQKTTLFSVWLQDDPAPSWEKVITALKMANENELALIIGEVTGISVLLPEVLALKINDKSQVQDEEAKDKLLSLVVAFIDLKGEVQKEVEAKLQQGTTTLSGIAHHLQTLVDDDLTQLKSVDELFQKINPYYDFLDCQIIVTLSEHCATPDFSQRVKNHSEAAMKFRESEPVEVLRKGLKEFYIPYINDSNTTNVPNVIINLNHAWDRVTIKGLYTLLEHLLPSNHKGSLLNLITISLGSVKIEYFLPKSRADDVKTNAKQMTEFLSLVGAFELKINNEFVLLEKENANFTFSSALFTAAGTSNIEAVQFLIDFTNADVNYSNEIGLTPLMNACINGYYEDAKLLLKHQADPNIQARDGMTALFIASQIGDYEMVELLLKQQADPNIQAQRFHGLTALYIASQNGHHQIVELLLKKKANPNIQAEDGATALFIACQNGHFKVVELLLKRQRANHNIRKNDGTTVLYIASQFGHHQVVELLLNRQAVPDIQMPNGSTALFIASQKGHYKVVEQLLKKQANPDIQTRRGATALYIASEHGYHQVVELLLKGKANPNIKTQEGSTALYIASQNGHHLVVELLLRYQVNNIPEEDGGRCLFLACRMSYDNIVKQLLRKQVNPNFKGSNGMTALMEASLNGNCNIVKILLEENADVDIQGTHGQTALMLASIEGHYEIVELLLKENANVNLYAEDGSTALSLAENFGNSHIVELLLTSHFTQ